LEVAPTLDNSGVLDGSHCDRFGALEKRKDCCIDVGLRMKRMIEKRRSSSGCRWGYLYLRSLGMGRSVAGWYRLEDEIEQSQSEMKNGEKFG
jgi:hypothetical protein